MSYENDNDNIEKHNEIDPQEGSEYIEDNCESYVEVEFRSGRIAYYSNTENTEIEPDDMIVIDVDRGYDIARVIHTSISGSEYSSMNEAGRVMSVIRKATEEDLIILDQWIEKEEIANKKFLELITKYPFEMKLIDTIYQFDGNKLTFFFTADGRIDFREFVRELAQVFKTRIELHQSTGRDEAKRLGGYGMCGNRYCCATFLKRFNQITIKMAKDQNLSGNLSKISGPCGRLLCCLMFEEDFYTEHEKDFPSMGDSVFYKGVKMYVFRNDYYNKQIYLTSEEQAMVTISLDEYRSMHRKHD